MSTSFENLENIMLDIKQSVVTRFLLKKNLPQEIIKQNKIKKNMTCEEYSQYVYRLHSEQISSASDFHQLKKFYMDVKSFFQKKY